MNTLFLGALGFAMFFLNNANDMRIRSKRLSFLFPLGCVIFCSAVIVGCVSGKSPVEQTALRIIICAIGISSLALMLHSLFFAIPAKDSYVRPGATRPVIMTGPYALCRHPGVLFFIILMLCLWLGLGLSPLCAVVWSLLNIALALTEDIIVFPALLEGYRDYKKNTPFLIPSLRRKNH